MRCPHFDAGECASCTLMGHPIEQQRSDKESAARQALADPQLTWLPMAIGPEAGFRNKAKLVVSGTTNQPTLGILDAAGAGVDLQDCGLYPPSLSRAFAPLAQFIRTAQLTPYDIHTRLGELKYIQVTVSAVGELMVRFVLRSREAETRIRKHLPELSAALPGLVVVSLNIHPTHAAVLEGDTELILTEAHTLAMPINEVVLHLRPGGFFQTNTHVAAQLYHQVTEWVDHINPRTVWDLYCGVGGFAVHLARTGRSVVGVESTPAAIAAAQRTVTEAQLPGVTFLVADAASFVEHASGSADLVIVNPPRRGIGRLTSWLEQSSARHVVYSSCFAPSLARDLAAMPSWRPVVARVFDMFPQTTHYEIAVLLTR